MISALPDHVDATLTWPWDRWQPHYQALAESPLAADSVAAWLASWTRLSNLFSETSARLSVATTVDTADLEAEARFRAFIGQVQPRAMAAEQALKDKLLASGLDPEGFAVPLRDMRAEAALFCEANLPLLAEDRRLGNEYNKIIAAQTVTWQGQERTLVQLGPALQSADRAEREAAWRLASARQLADRGAINDLWGQLLALRGTIAANAGLPSYRDYAWRARRRFDYTPDDCLRFHEAIETAVVPAATRIYEARRRRLALPSLRPWDTEARAPGEPTLRPFDSAGELIARAEAVLTRVDPQLGGYFATMRREQLLDLENRKGKAPGGYCTGFPVARRPFIFMNAVGVAGDVRTLLHEAGHAFHVFEMQGLPYAQQRAITMEFAEVASMAMELLAAPYLRQSDGGYYDEGDYARARVEHLEGIILFWPYMAVVDGFQHWAYTHPRLAADPAECDLAWGRLWARFTPGVDWSGLDEELVTGWHRKQHIHRAPFYYVEYGLAQLGAVQVWRNALRNQADALAAYRRALALGSTAPLPELYAAAGARFAFDSGTMQDAVDLIEAQIAELAQ